MIPVTPPSTPILHTPIVGSSSVASSGYDAGSQTLEIKYHGSGETHAYQGVPYDVHLKFLTSKSKGQFAHHVLKKQFRSIPVQARSPLRN